MYNRLSKITKRYEKKLSAKVKEKFYKRIKSILSFRFSHGFVSE